jgi:membrane-associated protease RseP (regulator of RpoE activity)
MQRDDINQSSFVQQDILPALNGLIEPTAIDRRENGAIIIRGRLLENAARVYPPLRARFERLGYTPFLRPHNDGIELIAARGVIARRPTRWIINVVLFVATICTVLLAGAQAELGVTPLSFFIQQPSLLGFGAPFAGTLLGILFAHEMGHYIVGRLRGAPASLPYFIPLPPMLSFTGTLGAVIVQREPFDARCWKLRLPGLSPDLSLRSRCCSMALPPRRSPQSRRRTFRKAIRCSTRWQNIWCLGSACRATG